MKRLILCVALSAFVCSLQAGDVEGAKDKPACANKPACCAGKAACAAKSGSSKSDNPACCKGAKSEQAKKVLMSPKAASLAEK